MVKIFASPSRYIQGKNVFLHADEYLADLGKKPILISDDNVWNIVGNKVFDVLKSKDFDVEHVTFGGEASDEEVKRISDEGKKHGADLVIGVGGGKTADTTKKIGDSLGINVAVLPTTASTDAPCSALSVMYNPDGTFKYYSFYDKNPNLVLIDTQVVAEAPVRTLAAGMGDAMATNVEARDVARGNNPSMVHGNQTEAALAIANTCMTNLFKHSQQAYAASTANVVTKSLDTVIEANTLLSGLGFESAGLAAAHAIYDAFTVLDGKIETLMHGEKVAYGTLCELMLDNVDEKELNKFIDFYQAIGLPTTLEDLYIPDVSYDDLLKVGKAATDPAETMKNMPFDVTPEDVADAILAVNAYVHKYNESTK